MIDKKFSREIEIDGVIDGERSAVFVDRLPNSVVDRPSFRMGYTAVIGIGIEQPDIFSSTVKCRSE